METLHYDAVVVGAGLVAILVQFVSDNLERKPFVLRRTTGVAYA